jgi:hypothetical protein
VDSSGVPYQYDYGHLTDAGSLLMADHIAEALSLKSSAEKE